MGFSLGVVLLLLTAVFAGAVQANTEDLGASNELENIIKNDHIVIALKHIKARKRHHGLETLYSVEFPTSKQKFSVLLDRNNKKVIIDTLEDGRPRSQHFKVDALQEELVIKSLILAINQRKPEADMTLYLDCVSYGKVATPKTLREMYYGMEEPQIKVLREKKYPLEIEGEHGLLKVLSRNNCPSQQDHPDFEIDTMYKRHAASLSSEHDHNIQGYQPDVYRGDIPMISDLDDGAILKAFNDLITSVNNLNKIVQQQHDTINGLRRFMEECDICKPRPPEIVRPSCATHPPNCFPGVQCHDTASGPRCGACPRGYLGDGYTCTPGRTCADRPCHPGVQCQDTSQGFRCGPCPSGYEGNGEQCRRRSGCEYNPCHPGESYVRY